MVRADVRVGLSAEGEGSTLDRKAALAQLKGGLMRMDVTGLSAKVVKVRRKGDGYSATVAWAGTMRATLQGRPAKLTAKWTDEQSWALVRGRWTLLSIVTFGFDRTVD